MAVYYKFRSAKDFGAVSIPDPFISLGCLKRRIAETHALPLFGKRGCEIVVSDAKTHEAYMDEETLIPRCASLLVCRVPLLRLRPLINAGYEVLKCTSDITASSTVTHSSISFESSIPPVELESDDFGPEIYTSIKVSGVQSSNPAQDVPPPTKAEGCWKSTTKIPHTGYICHRCNISGHFIKDCPTNGDSAYDFRERNLKSKFGPIDAPSVWESKSNEACNEREKQSLSSSQVANVIAPELCCPLCKTPIKEAVFASKCCFYSFCNKCITDHVVSKHVCKCGAAGMQVDDFVPNMTLRELIGRVFMSTAGSTGTSGTTAEIFVTEVLKFSPECFLYVSACIIESSFLLCKLVHHLFLHVCTTLVVAETCTSRIPIRSIVTLVSAYRLSSGIVK